jgi:hypothetical protein
MHDNGKIMRVRNYSWIQEDRLQQDFDKRRSEIPIGRREWVKVSDICHCKINGHGGMTDQKVIHQS